MKIEAIAKKNRIHQFSNVILGNYLNLLSRIFFFISKENWKIFQNRLLFPSERIFSRNDFDSVFYQRWFVLYTHVNYMHVYTQEAQHSPRGRRQPSRCQKPAAPQLFSIRFIFSLFFFSALSFLSRSFSLYLYPRTFENRYSEIISRRFFE